MPGEYTLSMGILWLGRKAEQGWRKRRARRTVHDAAHALANVSPYEDINQRLSWTPMLAITYA